MGRKCSAPGCRSNYDTEKNYVSVFKFPSDPERRNLWISSLNRANFNPGSSSVVCVKHFEEHFVVKEDILKGHDGSMLIIPRKKLTLTSEAYPTVFENLPLDLAKSLPTERKNSDLQLVERKRDDQHFLQRYSENIIKLFEDFTKNCKNNVGLPSKRPHLKNIAVPSLNLPVLSTESKKGSVAQNKKKVESKSHSNVSRSVQNKSLERPKLKPGRKRKKPIEGTGTDEDTSSSLKCTQNIEETLKINEDILTSEPSSSLHNKQLWLENVLKRLHKKVDSIEPVKKITVKVEKPWEKEYEFTEKDTKSVEECDKLPQVGNSNAEVSGSPSMYARPLKIQNKEELFGKFVASELSDLCQNPKLYIKTKQAILDILVQAHFEQIK